MLGINNSVGAIPSKRFPDAVVPRMAAEAVPVTRRPPPLRRTSRLDLVEFGFCSVVFRLTFWPRFYDPRNSSGNQVETKDLEAFRPGSCT